MYLVVFILVLIFIVVFLINWVVGLILFVIVLFIFLFMVLVGMGVVDVNWCNFVVLVCLSGNFFDCLCGLDILWLFNCVKVEID